MNKLAFIPLSLLITLLVAMMSSASASECLDNNFNRVDNKANTDLATDLDLAQMITCLTTELASFEKTNQELRVKVSELEKTVFEGFESNLSEKEMSELTYLKTNLLDGEVSNKVTNEVSNQISVDAVVDADSSETSKVFEKSHQ